jgi:hypothetical protein
MALKVSIVALSTVLLEIVPSLVKMRSGELDTENWTRRTGPDNCEMAGTVEAVPRGFNRSLP